MNDTLSTPDPAQQVAEVRRIIETRTFMHSCESTLLAIKRVVIPPPASDTEVPVNDRGWPELRESDWTDTGTGPGWSPSDSWERHDDPEANR